MGVPQFNNTRIPKFIDSYATTFYAYNNGNYNNKGQVEASPSDSDSQSSIFSDYLENGLTYAFIDKYNRQLTIAASALSVVILIILGACVWCVIGLVRKKQAEKEELQKSSKQTEGQDGSDDLDSSFCTSEGSPFNHSVHSVHLAAEGSENKTKGIIAKIFGRRKQKKNDTLSKIYAQHHRNIITPDKSIPFVVPTISLPAQPPGFGTKGDLVGDPISGSETPQPSTSKQALLQAQQFFPQLEHPEVDGCPLIAFTLYYEVASQILNVRLLEGRNFPDTVSHTVGVKIYPGRSGKQTTKEFKFRSPVYNVEFCFHVRKISLRTKILKLRAVIPGNPRRVIGYVNVALKDLPGLESVNGEEEISEDLKTTQLWRRVELPSEVGDGVKLQVSLKWVAEPSPGLLTLKIIEAAGLHENRDCDYTSSYVKVTLQEQGRNIKTRKTQLVRWGSVPVFDDVFVLTIPQTLLSQISFLLVIVARGRLGSKAVLGKISIGPVPYSIQAPGGPRTNPTSSSSSSAGMEIWEEMIHQPGKEIIRTLKLN